MKLHIFIDAVPPTYNTYLGKNRSQFIYQADKKKWFKKMDRAVKSLANPIKFSGTVNIRLTYTFPDRRLRDLDNYSGKFIMDPLVKLGIIEDDNYRIVRNLIINAKSGKEARTDIYITDSNEPDILIT